VSDILTIRRRGGKGIRLKDFINFSISYSLFSNVLTARNYNSSLQIALKCLILKMVDTNYLKASLFS